jgi:hypothetical protein
MGPRPELVVVAPRDLTVTCSCGQKLEGGAFALMVQAWTEIHDRTGHIVCVYDPGRLLGSAAARRAATNPLTVEHYRAFLLHHAPDPR